MVRVAMATNDGESISEGHFAHARKYVIYDVDEGSGDVRFVEVRDNPLGNIPDIEDPERIHEVLQQLGIPMHGVTKYQWLHENLLKDVDAVIASGACEMSYRYFTSSGVQLLFVEPGTLIQTIVDQLRSAVKEELEDRE